MDDNGTYLIGRKYQLPREEWKRVVAKIAATPGVQVVASEGSIMKVVIANQLTVKKLVHDFASVCDIELPVPFEVQR